MVQTPSELKSSFEDVAKGLESRFTAVLSYTSQSPDRGVDFEEVTVAELANVVRTLPNSAPGHDGMTTSAIKTVHKIYALGLLEIVNHLIRNSWITPDWRVAKVIPLLKKQGAGFTLDNITPISFTSNLVKLIERMLHSRVDRWLSEKMILSPCQIRFRRGCSICSAHVDLESRIQLA